MLEESMPYTPCMGTLVEPRKLHTGEVTPNDVQSSLN